ncbi:ATP-dependent DNA helicase RecG [Phocaeicola paurosaccharolyticus]|uniref:ATP-dependent DNA helicase RecG n=1 Tax=Phocaeicola paurosaccharolyticus TaxID=732242 RepID=UPI00046A58E2|nr:ATP-dependent DNA helicase RecG [Phocaeicola paurosaccharolyticus]
MFDITAQDIKYLQGVGPQRASVLNKEINIYTLNDLLHYYPYKYIDRSRLYYISEIDGEMPYIQIKGTILSFETLGEGRQRRLVAHFSDGTGIIDLIWFQGIKYITSKYKVREEYIVFGKPTVFNGRYNIAHPDIDKADDIALSSLGLRPYYNTTEKMKRGNLNSHAVEKLMQNALNLLKEPIAETLPQYIIDEHHLISLDKAIHEIHFPHSADRLRKAQYRLKFEELFYIQLNILRYSKERQMKFRGLNFSKVGDYFNDFYFNNLPFQLTGAQKRVIKEIRNDTGSGRQMNRLLQGDVGSGKTLVALMSMLIALDNGYQACMMAPTEILAQQHYESLKKLLFGMNVRVELLTGSIKGKKREAILNALLTGDVNILIGTHAVLEDNVNFSSLGIVVIDEQHRFGVAQRAKLWSKSNTPPHILVMTATPIPRTLAMTLYGDLDVSVIDELPPGRKPIKTVHQFDNRRHSLYESIRKQIEEGRQIYIVYPLIKESEKIDIKNLEEGYEHVCEEFPQYKVSVVHGKMKPGDKEEEMQKFVTGETQIMVATTVIEVGVNVPNASVMVIENAERFGLSQLHQLRGRVGRGADQSYCILVTGYKLSEETRKRIQIMVDTNDGFEIAEADLKLRGPGDLEGTQQSGIAFDLKIANLAKDGQIVQYVRNVAEKVIDNPNFEQLNENKKLWEQLKLLRKNDVNWSVIS